LTLGERIQTIPSLAASYLRLAFIPAGLSPAYDLGYLREISISAFWLPLATLLVVGVLLFYLSKRHREFRLAVILAAIPLAPHFNVTAFPSGELLHDRYLYLPLVGIGLMVALLIEAIALRIKLPFAPVAAVKAGLVVMLLAMTIGQNRIWASNEVLWTYAVKHAPESRVARLWLGSMAEDRQDLETAVSHYNAVLSIHPDVLDALNNSAFAYAHMKRWPEAIRNFERVVSIVPLQAISHFNLSVAYAAARRYPEEARELRAAIELAGDNPQAAEWHSRLEYLTNGLLTAPVEKEVSR
jgi:tetratricopeptide (TPR) repeat protein